MKICELAKALELDVVALPSPDTEISGCYIGDLLSHVMTRAENGNVWITIMTNINTVAVASFSGVSAITVAEGLEIPCDVISAANEHKVNILRSKLTAFETALRVGRLVSE